MNQEQVHALLLRIREPREEFTVVLTGKRSRRVNGLYKPETREILIHNRNFAGDTELVYTAIHEYAHHLQFTSGVPPASTRTHTTAERARVQSHRAKKSLQKRLACCV